MNLTVWKLAPNIYEFDIFLAISSEKLYDIISIFNKKYNLGYIEGEDFTKDEENNTPQCLVNTENRIAIILLPSFTYTPDDIASIAHELLHIITVIGSDINLKINETTTEAWAYFISFYMKIILEELKIYLDEKNKNKKNFNLKYINPSIIYIK